MLKNRYKVIGVMSGTSLDGIDFIWCEISLEDEWKFKILATETRPYSIEWKSKLENLISLTDKELLLTDQDYTRLLSKEIISFISQHNISDIDLIASHGHTARHLPDEGLTYQIGNLDELADLVNQRIVCDFRVQDVELNGQGAPLVPIGDQLFFGEFGYCLNLGGFSNVSFQSNADRHAFDISPVNIVLNYCANKMGLEYDKDGQLAESGNLNKSLLEQLNNLEYYKQSWPKSLGKEWVDAVVLPLIRSYNLKVEDVLKTFVEHIAIQVKSTIDPGTTVLVTGGGAFNSFLMKRIRNGSQASFILPEKEIIEYKEALIFALLGVLKIRNEINCLSSVTGASRDHSSGRIIEPKIVIT
ncbi:anhydro-N-acetylmuramic acid kinase [Winogradskyella aurantiaca]|uniref:anhydro-N-acetylmuramic acid kinase n=1 Tax=Winogradskyella aurantiaca TaxID=2219558 RepID=UPI000E1D16AA|nr:anhydro-N-acetylmuramic acid kinase [Winogradskyella aurantiaca]